MKSRQKRADTPQGGQRQSVRAASVACVTRRSRMAGVVALVVATAAASVGGGCAGTYRGPRTLGAVAVGILATSATMWVIGERTGENQLTRVGAAGAAVGAAAAIGAGTWLAGSVGCRVDPDCPENEACREIPAPPGHEPFRQCAPR